MSGSIEQTWAFKVGDLIRWAPSRKHWDYYDGYGNYGYPYTNTPKHSEKIGAIGIIVERYEKYGYHSHMYYKIKWMDNRTFSNEKHEDLQLVSSAEAHKK